MSLPNENISFSTPRLYQITYTQSNGLTERTDYATIIAETYRKQVTRSSTPGFNNPNRVTPLLNLPYYRLEQQVRYFYGTRRKWTASSKIGQSGYYSEVQSGPIDGASSVNTYVSPTFEAAQLSIFQDRLNQKLLSKIKGSNINLGVVWGERQKTIDMLAQTAGKLAGALSHLRKGDFMGAARDLGIAGKKRANSRFNADYAKDRARALGSGWLELQYGWKPLLTDLHGAVEELVDSYIAPHTMTVYAANAFSENVSFIQTTNDAGLRRSVFVNGVKSVNLRGGVTFYRKPGAPQDLPRLGITNPAVVAWELVPFSFVVDWIWPIGNWLETLDATLGVEFLTGFNSVKQSATLAGVATTSGVASGLTYEGTTSSSSTFLDFRRTVLTDFPSVGLPRFKNPVSTGHMWNALALLSQMVGRR